MRLKIAILGIYLVSTSLVCICENYEEDVNWEQAATLFRYKMTSKQIQGKPLSLDETRLLRHIIAKRTALHQMRVNNLLREIECLGSRQF